MSTLLQLIPRIFYFVEPNKTCSFFIAVVLDKNKQSILTGYIYYKLSFTKYTKTSLLKNHPLKLLVLESTEIYFKVLLTTFSCHIEINISHR